MEWYKLDGSGNGGMTHDGAGRVTAEFGRTYTYDDFHSLVRAGAASGSNAQGFQYDAVGRLIAVRRGTAGWPVEEELAYDGTQMVAAWNGAGVATWSAVWGQGVDNLISVKPGVDGAEVMALKDGRGSVVGYYQAMATPQGLLATADYTPEGRVTSKDWVTGTTCTETGSTQCPRLGGLPFGFHGAYKSPAHGLLYFRNRWYSAEAGQWLTQDPLGEVDSVNLYAFNRFDSVNFIDPFGLSGQGAAGGVSDSSVAGLSCEDDYSCPYAPGSRKPLYPAPVGGSGATVSPAPLLRGTAGDSFSVFQSRSPSTAPIPYRSVIAAGKTVAPDLVDGSNVTFPVVLSEPLPTSIGVRLDVPAATQVLRESRPATPVAAAAFVITYRRGLHRIGVVSRGNNGLEAGMQVLSADLPATQPVFQGQVQWGDVFPREELLATMSARMNVVVSAGLAGGTLEVPYERSLPLTGSQVNLDVTMSAPRALLVNGEPAVGNRVGVTTTPTLSWAAPVRGLPNRYAITIYDLADKTFKKNFFTTRTTLEVPPLTLVAGKTYAFVVVAERGAYDLLRPTYTPAETERVGACSDAFTP